VFLPLDVLNILISVHPRLLADIGPGKISAVLVKLADNTSPTRAWVELEKAIPELTVVQPAKVVRRTQNEWTGLSKALDAVGFAVWPLGAAMLALVFALSAHRRKRELGLMHALGAGPGFARRLLVAEALLPALVGAPLGVAAVAVWSLVLGEADLARAAIVQPALAAVGLALATVVLAALLPALWVGKLEPHAAIRSDT
jgi:putative ABC transport system permease protein